MELPYRIVSLRWICLCSSPIPMSEMMPQNKGRQSSSISHQHRFPHGGEELIDRCNGSVFGYLCAFVKTSHPRSK